MPRQRPTVSKEYSNFIAGLITEASQLTYPENASSEEENFILNRNGSRRRRQGIDYESGGSLSADIATSTFSDLAVTNHVWENAANSGLYSFSVVQTGSTLYFYDRQQADLSSNVKAFTVDLSTYATASAQNIGSKPIFTASGRGLLFVVSEDTEPFYISYDKDNDTISVTQITIEIRDFLGLPEAGLDTDGRPTTLSLDHQYNLYNQGWSQAHIDTYFSSSSTTVDFVYNPATLSWELVIDTVANAVYPSNAQVWTAGKNSTGVFNQADLDEIYFGNTPAPRGHYILNAFARDRDTAASLSGISTETEKGRPSAVAFYAGRAFYSGVRSDADGGPSVNGYVYYSQLIEDEAKVGKCYQVADPTSEIISDLVATDGGVIVIPEVGVVHRLEPVRDSLVIFADNGVWELRGDTDAGFTADAFQVSKITNVGSISSSSVVTAEGNVFYWSDGGIYVLATDNASGRLSPTNITETTVQTLYQGLSSSSRLYATGHYDSVSKKVSWLYNGDSTYTGSSYVNKYDTELVFDTVLTAFYKNTISSLASNSPYVAGYVSTPNLITADVSRVVTVGGVAVTVGGVDVTIGVAQPSGASTATKYLTVVPLAASTNSKIIYSLYNNSSFTDWVGADGTGVDYTSYLVTGHELLQDSQRDKQATYITFHFSRTETGFITDSNGDLVLENPSGCKYQSRWDFSDSTNSGRWSSELPAYRFNRNYIPSGSGDTFDYGFDVITTKNKVRGKGKALALYLTSETGKDCEILGWSVTYTGTPFV